MHSKQIKKFETKVNTKNGSKLVRLNDGFVKHIHNNLLEFLKELIFRFLTKFVPNLFIDLKSLLSNFFAAKVVLKLKIF